MKKILCLAITFLMILECFCVMVSAENQISVISAINVADGGQGVGYYDTSTSGALETTSDAVILRSGEWVLYDVSHLEEGIYTLSVTAANQYATTINIHMDSKAQFLKCNILATQGYSDYQNTTLGKIVIKKDTKNIKLSNLTSGKEMYLKSLNFEKISNKTYFTDTEILGKDTVSDVEGEGFHDENGSDFYSSSVTSGGSFILHYKDWAAYKTSDIKPGAYEVYANYSAQNDVAIEILTDNRLQIQADLASTGSYRDFAEAKIGTLHIGDADKLIVRSSKTSFYLKSLKLVYKSDSKLEKVNIINGSDIISNVDGEGFYDNQNLEINQGGVLEVSGTSAVLRKDEWVIYDISGYESGTYGIYASVSNKDGNATLVIETDNEDRLSVRSAKKASYSDYEEIYFGNIEISEKTTKLKLTNTSAPATQIRKIYIKSSPIKENLKYSQDAAGSVDIIGFDGKNTVYLTGNIKNDFYAPQEFVLYTACYSENSKLLSLSRNEIECKISETKKISIPISITDGTYVIKAFIWGVEDGCFPVFTEKVLYSGIVKHFYVDAQGGNDSNSGTKDKPFKTIEKAQEKLREENDSMTGDIYVHLSGTFEVDETLEFTQADSGKNGYSVIYDGEGKTTISGGRRIEGFTPVSGTPLYKADAGHAGFRQLYINGNRADRAKSKWLYFAKDTYKKADTTVYETDGYILSGSDFPKDFTRPYDMEFVWMPSWKNIRMPVETFTKNEDNDYVVTFPQPYFDSTEGLSLSIPYYIENAPEFLDEPGEWYHNKDTGEVFYYPYETENMQTAEVYVPKAEILLTLAGNNEEKIENITFKGVSFCYGAWERTSEKGISPNQAEYIAMPENKTDDMTSYPYEVMPAQISVDYGNNINFKDNKFSHLGSVAVSLDNKTENSDVTGNVFDDISASAVTISNPKFEVGAKVEEFCRNIEVTNNLIRRISVEYMTPAITGYYVNNTKISHNDIKDCPYTGISLGWGWGKGVINCKDNEISNNRIENVLYKLKDGGHIYTLDIMDGTVVENNYLIKSGEDKGGIYLDNATENLLIRNNVFEDCPRWLKQTYHNVNGNVAYNNYSESKYNVKNPEKNNIETEIGKQNGEWPKEAEEIISSAGLEESYKKLITEYDAFSHYRNNLTKRQRYENQPGILIPAGNVMEGGEGVAYHDSIEGPYALGITYEYNGTGLEYVMVTTQGEWTKYKFDVQKAGLYNIYLKAAATSNYPRVSIWIDDVLAVDKGKIVNTETYSVFVENNMGSVYLDEGPHTVKVEHSVSNFGFYSLRFATNDDVLVRNDGFVESIVSEITNSKGRARTIHAVNNILNKVPGQGFYDAGEEEKFETHNDLYVVLRPGDWVCYDVSELSAGFYGLSISEGTKNIDAKVTVEIDGDAVIENHDVANTTAYTLMEEQDLGEIVIPQRAESIKFKNNSAYTFYLESFTLG